MGTLLLLAIVGLTCSTVTGQQIKIFAGSPDRQDDLVSLNERVLFCRVTDLSGRVSDVRNAVFLLNGIDVLLNLTAGDYIVNPERGRIEFEITQRLEGRYTCGNGNIQSINHLDVVGESLLAWDRNRYCILVPIIKGKPLGFSLTSCALNQ